MMQSSNLIDLNFDKRLWNRTQKQNKQHYKVKNPQTLIQDTGFT